MASADIGSNAPDTSESGTKREDGSDTPGDGNKEDTEKSSASFECNICLDTAKDAVVSVCGHLFW